MTAASSCPDVGSDFNVTSDVQSPYFVLFHQPETEFKQSSHGRHLKELCMHAVTEVAVAMLKLEAEVNEAAP